MIIIYEYYLTLKRILQKEKKALIAIFLIVFILIMVYPLFIQDPVDKNYKTENIQIEKGDSYRVFALSSNKMLYWNPDGFFTSDIFGQNKEKISSNKPLDAVFDHKSEKFVYLNVVENYTVVHGVEIYDIGQKSIQSLSYDEIMYNSYPSRNSDYKYLSWSPGDERITFILKNNTKPYTLYIWNPVEERCSPVFNSSSIFYLPSWSPDGSYLSVMAQDNSGNGTPGLYVIDLMNSSVISISSGIGDINNYNPETSEWSPEGDKIAYSSNGNIVICGTSGNTILEIPCCENCICQKLEWNPDGDRILYKFNSQQQQFTIIGIAESDGSGTKTLLKISNKQSKYNYYPYWTENGTKVVYYMAGLADDNCFIIDPEVPGWDNLFRFIFYFALFIVPACCIAGWYFWSGSEKN